MATGNRKRSATGKKSSSGRKTNSGHKRNTKKQQEREAEFTREVILWIVVAVSLLLFISNFGFGGTIGGTVSRFFFGLFGIISYIFPIVLLVGTFFAVSNQGNRVAAVKLVAVILFVAFLCMFFELISDGTDAKSAMDAYRYSFDAKSGGGLIGGGLSHMLCSGFGVIGAYVIDVIVLIRLYSSRSDLHFVACKKVGAGCMSLPKSAMNVTENVLKCEEKSVSSGNSSAEWTERLRALPLIQS